MPPLYEVFAPGVQVTQPVGADNRINGCFFGSTSGLDTPRTTRVPLENEENTDTVSATAQIESGL